MVVEGNSIYRNLIYALGKFEGDIIAVKSVKWYGCPMIYERLWYNLYVYDKFSLTLRKNKTALEYSSFTLYLNIDMHIVNRFVFSILLISLTQRDIHFYHHYRWCSMGKHITRIDYWDSFRLRCRNFCSLSTDSEQKFVEFLSWFCLSVHGMNKLDAQYLPVAAI